MAFKMRGFPFKKTNKPVDDTSSKILFDKLPGLGRSTVDTTLAEKSFNITRIENELKKRGYDLSTRSVDSKGNITYILKDVADVVPGTSKIEGPDILI